MKKIFKWGAIVVVALMVIGAIAGGGEEKADQAATDKTSQSKTTVTEPVTEVEPVAVKEEPAEPVVEPEPKPELTVSQENAISTARDYLDYSAFSKSGLIGQLEFEDYSTADATFAADRAGADWKAEAAESAKDYLDYSSFSRAGLIDQLVFEGFSTANAVYGVNQTGL